MAQLPKFPLPYIFEVEKGLKFATQEVVFASGKKQVRQNAVTPTRTWNISLRGTTEQQKTFVKPLVVTQDILCLPMSLVKTKSAVSQPTNLI